jgi:hypothetical protein
MIHVVAMEYPIGLPLLIRIELLWRSRSFKNWGVEVGAFVYRLHSPGEYRNKFTVLHLIVYLWTSLEKYKPSNMRTLYPGKPLFAHIKPTRNTLKCFGPKPANLKVQERKTQRSITRLYTLVCVLSWLLENGPFRPEICQFVNIIQTNR